MLIAVVEPVYFDESRVHEVIYFKCQRLVRVVLVANVCVM